jgi:hypothetical protein
MEETLEGGRGLPQAVAPLERERKRERVRLLHSGLQAPQDRRNDTSSVDEGSEIVTSAPGTRI